jgi:hypothetical protein
MAKSAAPAAAKKAASASRGVVSRRPNPPERRGGASSATTGSDCMSAGGGCSTRSRAARSSRRSAAATWGESRDYGVMRVRWVRRVRRVRQDESGGSLYMFLALCVGFGFWVRLRLALRSLALCRVCAVAPNFVSGWRAFFPSLSATIISQRVPERNVYVQRIVGGYEHVDMPVAILSTQKRLRCRMPTGGPCVWAQLYETTSYNYSFFVYLVQMNSGSDLHLLCS